jgi:isopentenyl diphosphate isomerase/L-lactate dehydrogenase-like FMN-dependent dehydrogenase
MSRSVASPQVVNIEDLRRIAKRRLPRVAFDYIDGGADGEKTLRENCRVFDDVKFRPRSAVVTQAADLRTSVLGTPIALPLLLGPVGSCRIFYPRGTRCTSAEGVTWRFRPSPARRPWASRRSS